MPLHSSKDIYHLATQISSRLVHSSTGIADALSSNLLTTHRHQQEMCCAPAASGFLKKLKEMQPHQHLNQCDHFAASASATARSFSKGSLLFMPLRQTMHFRNSSCSKLSAGFSFMRASHNLKLAMLHGPCSLPCEQNNRSLPTSL